MSVALHLPPLAPVGITFEWQDDELVVKAFVNFEGERARAAGVVIGSALAAINGNSLEGWAFPELFTNPLFGKSRVTSVLAFFEIAEIFKTIRGGGAPISFNGAACSRTPP